MGRTDAVQVILEVVAECRRLLPALVVSYEPGWETRGNGTRANYNFGNGHHTASNSSAAKPFPTQTILRNGRSDLPGPLCNFAGPWCTPEQPRLHVMAANPANHAGASRASGPVPALSLYNPRTLGLEIDYAGLTPMTAGQMLVFQAWAKAIAKVVGGGNIEVVRAHAETSVTGKWDPGYANGKTIDMAAFRRGAANLTQQEDDMPLTDADVTKLFWGTPFKNNDNFAQVIHRIDDGLADVETRVADVEAKVAAPAQQKATVNVDAAAVAAALAKDATFLGAIAKVVADENARRQAS